MLWIKAFHLITMVAWFAGLFYLPRLFVYHAQTTDAIGDKRFKVMEHKLYYYIMTPAAILTTGLGIWLLTYSFKFYMQLGWMHSKLFLVVLLWLYHGYCGYLVHQFNLNNNQHSSAFYRWFNEVPTVLLIAIILLAVVKP